MSQVIILSETMQAIYTVRTLSYLQHAFVPCRASSYSICLHK